MTHASLDAKDIFLLCRSGFESELAQEIQTVATNIDVYGYVQTQPMSGFVIFHCYSNDDGMKLLNAIDVNRMVFARDIMLTSVKANDLSLDNRVIGLIECMPSDWTISMIVPWAIDTNDGKSLAKLTKKLVSPLKQGLTTSGKWDKNSRYALSFIMDSGSSGFVGISLKEKLPVWTNGIAHLKMPKSAPSRSTLKLEEALIFFLDKKELQEHLRLGKTAVDLGACPGGWTYQLVKRDVHVYAIDNGAMAADLMATGLVEAIRADGFKFKPPHKVDWLVCDMVEKPLRIAELMAHWLVRGWCERAIFNLKLPMKKRFQELSLCIQTIKEIILEGDQQDSSVSKMGFELDIKQLYHDREEVTCYLRRRNDNRIIIPDLNGVEND